LGENGPGGDDRGRLLHHPPQVVRRMRAVAVGEDVVADVNQNLDAGLGRALRQLDVALPERLYEHDSVRTLWLEHSVGTPRQRGRDAALGKTTSRDRGSITDAREVRIPGRKPPANSSHGATDAI